MTTSPEKRMDIHLLLEGEQVGPLSEAQVRQYLNEGRASVTDLASCEGMADWMPLEVVLNHFRERASTRENNGVRAAMPQPPSPVEAASAQNDTPFVLHKDAAESPESSPTDPLRQKTQALTSTQRTKRKAGKIVIQPILPLETTLPTKRRSTTGKATVSLESLRPTTALPPGAGHPPHKEKREPKGATQSGQMSFKDFTEPPVTPPATPLDPQVEPPVEPEPEAATIAAQSVVAEEPAASVPPTITTDPTALRATEPTPSLTEQPSPAALPEPAAAQSVAIAEPPAPVETTPPPPALAPALTEPVAALPAAVKETPVAVETTPASPAPAPAPPTAVAEPPVTINAPAAPVTPAPASPPTRQAAPAATLPVDVLPPPVERLSAHWKKPDARRSNGRLFSPVAAWAFYSGLALVLLLIGGIIAIVYWMVTHQRQPTAADSATSVSAAPSPAPSAAPTPPADALTASELSDHGLALQAKGDLDRAIADYDKAVSLDPKNIEAYYRRGLARQAKGDLAGAMADNTQVITLDPQRANAFSNRAYIKQTQGDLDGALADYFQALLINPNIAAAYNNMGLIKVKKGDLDGAIAAYNQALEINPTMAFAFYNRGVAKNTEGDVDGAIADYTQALTLNPNIAIAYYNRGMIKLQQGDLDGTVADNSDALTLNPKYGQAYYHRGLAYFGLGNLDDARADLEQFCQLTPRDPATDTARNYLWLVNRQQNPTGDADAQLSRAVLNDWNCPPEDLTSKIAAFLLGHIGESELIANAASPDPKREPGQYCRVWYFAGMKRLLNGEANTAATYFEKSVGTGQKDYYEYTFAQRQLQPANKMSDATSRPGPGN